MKLTIQNEGPSTSSISCSHVQGAGCKPRTWTFRPGRLSLDWARLLDTPMAKLSPQTGMLEKLWTEQLLQQAPMWLLYEYMGIRPLHVLVIVVSMTAGCPQVMHLLWKALM